MKELYIRFSYHAFTHVSAAWFWLNSAVVVMTCDIAYGISSAYFVKLLPKCQGIFRKPLDFSDKT